MMNSSQEALRKGVSLHIQFECGKTQTRITPNTDTFHAVNVCQIDNVGWKFCIQILTFQNQAFGLVSFAYAHNYFMSQQVETNVQTFKSLKTICPSDTFPLYYS